MDNTSGDILQAKADEDCWHLVTDAKKRKQIQDRLAQRARRGFFAPSSQALIELMLNNYDYLRGTTKKGKR
jgi:hypothetical protein